MKCSNFESIVGMDTLMSVFITETMIIRDYETIIIETMFFTCYTQWKINVIKKSHIGRSQKCEEVGQPKGSYIKMYQKYTSKFCQSYV